VLLLDLSGSTLSFRQTLKQAAIRFIDALAPDDRVAVIAFNDKVNTLVDFTTDRRKVAFAIQYAEGKGGTELFKALNYSLEQLGKEMKRRKAIVVLTDGIDTQMRNSDRRASNGAPTKEVAIASIKPETSAALNAVLHARAESRREQ
jgi:VWFA-related protein